MSIFAKFSEACSRVLKGQNASAPEIKTMTLDEFSTYATAEIEKALEDQKSPAKAVARLKALQLAVAVAQSAFEGASLEKFDIPIYSAKAALEQDVMARLDAMDANITALADGVGKGGDDDDAKKKKADEEAAAKKKEDEEKAAKGGDADDADAKKKKADEEAAAKKKKDDEEKAAAQKNADAATDGREIWSTDLARDVRKTKDDIDLYDWGADPEDPADAVGA